MSLNAVLSNALSGFAVAQNALSVTSQQRRQRQHGRLLAAAGAAGGAGRSTAGVPAPGSPRPPARSTSC